MSGWGMLALHSGELGLGPQSAAILLEGDMDDQQIKVLERLETFYCQVQEYLRLLKEHLSPGRNPDYPGIEGSDISRKH